MGCKKIDAERAMACVVKDTGDDFMDVRGGIKICAIVRLFEGSGRGATAFSELSILVVRWRLLIKPGEDP